MQLRQVMGHIKASTFEKYYASKTNYVDTQSVLFGQVQRTDLTSQLERAGTLRDEGLPAQLPEEKRLEVEEDQELKRCCSEVHAKKQELQAKFGSIKSAPSSDQKEYLTLKRGETTLRQRLEKTAIDRFRNSWMKAKQRTLEGLQAETTSTSAEDFAAYIRLPDVMMKPERFRIAVAMFGHSASPHNIHDLVRDLTTLCTSGRYGTIAENATMATPDLDLHHVKLATPIFHALIPQGKRRRPESPDETCGRKRQKQIFHALIPQGKRRRPESPDETCSHKRKKQDTIRRNPIRQAPGQTTESKRQLKASRDNEYWRSFVLSCYYGKVTW